MNSALVVARDSLLDPDRRRSFAMAPGSSVADIVAEAYASAPASIRDLVRATIDGKVVPQQFWKFVRPKAGTTIVLCPVPSGDVLRNVLTIAVTIGAIALGQFYAPILAGALLGLPGAAASGTLPTLLSFAISGTALLASTLLINALIPPSSRSGPKPTYLIQGFQNQATPDGAIPFVLGKCRFAPPYAGLPYTETVGDRRYVRAAFWNGYGPLVIRDPRIGETPVEKFKDVEIEHRAGLPGDTHLTLYPRQVIEKGFNIELKRDGPYGGEQSRFSASDITDCEIDITFPAGLAGYKKNGKRISMSVTIQAMHRLVGSDIWETVPPWTITAKSQKPLTRSFPLTFAVRGRREFKLTRVSPDDPEDQSGSSTQRYTQSNWTCIRGFRPEYLVNFDKPISLSALRVPATTQTNGTLDEYNHEVASLCPDWDAATQTYVTRETSNPASLFRYVLEGPGVAYPLTSAEIADLREWHAFCVAKGLTYNRILADTNMSVLDVLNEIAAAGRASPHDNGTQWDVVIDRALDFVAAHISPRNSWGFQGSRSFARFPHAFRVRFNNERNNYKPADRIVPWPGFSGDPTIIEEIFLPGVTNPDRVFSETRKLQYELLLRPDTYIAHQDFEAITYKRGDRVELSHDVIDRAQTAARVRAVRNQTGVVIVALDDFVTMEAGQNYAIRFRRQDGTSIVRTVKTVAGQVSSVTLTGSGLLEPEPGDLVMFGTAARTTSACTVKGIEAMKNLTARITLTDHAGEIEAMVDADVPPLFDGRAGTPVDETTDAPPAPIITAIESGQNAVGAATPSNPYPVVVSIEANPLGTARIASFDVRNHLTSGGSFISSAPVGNGSVVLSGYIKNDSISVEARAVTVRGTPGNWTSPPIIHIVGSDDDLAPDPPSALSATSPSAGTIAVSVTSGPESQTAATRIYLASGAGSTFSVATLKTTIASGPNVALPLYTITGLTAGAYRVWATTLDDDAPANESTPAGPVDVTVT